MARMDGSGREKNRHTERERRQEARKQVRRMYANV